MLHYVLIFSLFLHPFHISVTEIEFDDEVNSVEIAQKIFIDDLGNAISTKEGSSVDLFQVEENEKTAALVRSYVESNFKVVVNGKPTVYEFLGVAHEDDVVWCFMEVPKTKKLKSIKVTNTLLTEVFDDQVNLIHIKVNGKTRSMKLEKNEPSDILTY